MKPRRIVVSFALVVAFSSGIALAQFSGPIFNFRHELSPQFDIFDGDGKPTGAKVQYLRDKADPSTCTQVIIVGDKILPVSANVESCRW